MKKLEAYESDTSYFRFYLLEDSVYNPYTDRYFSEKAVHIVEDCPMIHLDELKQMVKLLEEYTP